MRKGKLIWILVVLVLAVVVVSVIRVYGAEIRLKKAVISQDYSLSALEDKGIVTKELAKRIKEKPEETQTIILTFDEKPKNYKRYINNLGGKIKYDYNIIEGVAVELPNAAIERLGELNGILRIEEDEILQPVLSESVPLIGADDVWSYETGYDGTGVKVCVLDTGIEKTHPSFRSGAIIGEYDFYNDDNDASDDDGHGTHVSGIIASNNAIYKGVAPGVSLLIGKVCGAGVAGCPSSAITAGIGWCKDNGADIISMSLGGGTKYTDYCDYLTNAQAINNAIASGIFVSVASGNNGWIDGISAPACASGATSVGAVYDANMGRQPPAPDVYSNANCFDATTSPNKITCYSNRGSILDLLAPGSLITSSCKDTGGGFCEAGGTSMAAPHVAGLAALMLEKNLDLTPFQIETMINNSGISIYDDDNSRNNGPGSGLTFPRIDALEAIQAEVPLPQPKVCFIPYSQSSVDSSAEQPFINLLRSMGYQVDYNIGGCNYDLNDIIDQTADFTGYDFWAHSCLYDGEGTSSGLNNAKDYYVDELRDKELILGLDVEFLADFGYATQNMGDYPDGLNGVGYNLLYTFVTALGDILPDSIYSISDTFRLYSAEGIIIYATMGDLGILDSNIITYLDDDFGEGNNDYRIMGSYESQSSSGKMAFLGVYLDSNSLADSSFGPENGMDVMNRILEWLTEEPESISITFDGGPISFDTIEPGSYGAGGSYSIIIDSSAGNVDVYQYGDDYISGSDTININNMKWNGVNDYGSSASVAILYSLLDDYLENVGTDTYPIYYWMNIPSSPLPSAGTYNSKIYIKAVPAGSGAPSSMSFSSQQPAPTPQPTQTQQGGALVNVIKLN